MRAAVVAALILASTPALAEVYRCTVGGKTVYTDAPCAPGTAPAALPPLTHIDAQPTNTPAIREFDAQRQREAAATQKDNAAWLGSYRTRKAHQAAVTKAVAEHRAIKGMTMDEVRSALGDPARVDGEGDNQRWTYFNGRTRRTLSFAAGVLKSDRAARPRRY